MQQIERHKHELRFIRSVGAHLGHQFVKVRGAARIDQDETSPSRIAVSARNLAKASTTHGRHSVYFARALRKKRTRLKRGRPRAGGAE
jgi:hypothetical protein